MKLEDGRITTLFNDDGLTIELHDSKANTQFAKIKLTPTQVTKAFSRLGYVECSIELFGLERVGLKHENKKFEFILPVISYTEEKKIAKELVIKRCPKGWVPDLFFNSQDSFFDKDGKRWARTTIRRWR